VADRDDDGVRDRPVPIQEEVVGDRLGAVQGIGRGEVAGREPRRVRGRVPVGRRGVVVPTGNDGHVAAVDVDHRLVDEGCAGGHEQVGVAVGPRRGGGHGLGAVPGRREPNGARPRRARGGDRQRRGSIGERAGGVPALVLDGQRADADGVGYLWDRHQRRSARHQRDEPVPVEGEDGVEAPETVSIGAGEGLARQGGEIEGRRERPVAVRASTDGLGGEPRAAVPARQAGERLGRLHGPHRGGAD
jgi:hypothetical protein